MAGVAYWFLVAMNLYRQMIIVHAIVDCVVAAVDVVDVDFDVVDEAINDEYSMCSPLMCREVMRQHRT